MLILQSGVSQYIVIGGYQSLATMYFYLFSTCRIDTMLKEVYYSAIFFNIYQTKRATSQEIIV
jgi:hypothetical protein